MVKRVSAYATALPAAASIVRDGEARLMFDASALTKRYASETGRNRVLALFASASELLVAAHCKTEVASALLRRSNCCAQEPTCHRPKLKNQSTKPCSKPQSSPAWASCWTRPV
jgi:hypothetical protein